MRPTCALDICTVRVNDTRVKNGAKYCSDACRIKNAHRRSVRGESKTLHEPTVEERVEKEGERLRQNELKRTLTQLGRSAAKRQAYIDTIKSVLDPFESSEVFPLPQVSEKRTEVDWAICLSDWHVGQYTAIETTNDMYEQTVAVTRLQVDKLLAALTYIFHESQGKRVRRLWVLVLGDIVEGDSMRPAQLREIEIPVVKQTVEGADLLAYFIRSVGQLPGVEEVIVDCVSGNHDRTTTKPGNAGLGETDYCDSFAFLIAEMLKRAFSNDDRIEITNHESFFGVRKFGGLRHAYEHGSSIRGGGGSYGGIPFYGIVNSAQKYESMLEGVDVVWYGHLHCAYTLPLGQRGRIIGNGALPATSRFVQSRYKTIRRPQQTLVEMHRNHGITAIRDLYADVGLQAPGEVWKNM